jgi:hypothetical protein
VRVCTVQQDFGWGTGAIINQGPKCNNRMIRTCWVQKDTRPIQKARNKGPFLPEADHIPKQEPNPGRSNQASQATSRRRHLPPVFSSLNKEPASTHSPSNPFPYPLPCLRRRSSTSQRRRRSRRAAHRSSCTGRGREQEQER